MKAPITLTEAAISYIKETIASHHESVRGLRVDVVTGGCSGLKYTFELVKDKEAGDEIVESDGVIVYIAPQAMLHLLGSVMDYEETITHSRLVFSNPNEKGSCGCGESFYT